MTFRMKCVPLVALALLAGGAGPALAQDAALTLELNTAETVDSACRLTFVARNDTAADLSRLVLETVLFTAEGTVGELTLFDVGALPVGKTRVRRFDLSGYGCAALGSVLVNGVDTCAGEGVAPGLCSAALRLSSRTTIGLDG